MRKRKTEITNSKLKFALFKSYGETAEACKLLAEGSSVSRVKASVTVTWDKPNASARGEQTFTYSDEFMQGYAEDPNGKMFSAVFSGLDALQNVKVQAHITVYNGAGEPIASIAGYETEAEA